MKNKKIIGLLVFIIVSFIILTILFFVRKNNNFNLDKIDRNATQEEIINKYGTPDEKFIVLLSYYSFNCCGKPGKLDINFEDNKISEITYTYDLNNGTDQENEEYINKIKEYMNSHFTQTVDDIWKSEMGHKYHLFTFVNFFHITITFEQ